MSNRLNQDREKRLQPIRMHNAYNAISKKGYKVAKASENHLEFFFKGEIVKYYAYSGWATGKTIQDGRGLKNLLKQI